MDRHRNEQWLGGLVASLARATSAAELGDVLVRAACDAARADVAWLTCARTASDAAQCRTWAHPAGYQRGLAQGWCRHRLAVPIGGSVDGRLEVARRGPRPFSEQESTAVALIAQLSAFALASVIALDDLRDAERRFRTLVEQLPLAIYIDAIDDGATSMYNNPANELITGCSDEEWKADPNLFSKLLHPDDRERVLTAFADARESHEPVSTEYRIIRRDGSQVWVRDEAVVVRDEAGRAEHVQGYLLDITRQRTAEDELARQALHDPVTGIANRRCFDERFEAELGAARTDTLAVMFIDLDNFKNVNDRHGHQAGDAVLRAAAAGLRSGLRDDDFLARLGGDEFVAIIPGLPPGRDEATKTAVDVVNRLLEAVTQDLVENGQRIPISASIGVALWPHDGHAGGSLLRQADASMYRAKQEGRNRFRLAG